MTTDTIEKTKTITKVKVALPSMFSVIYMNDEQTSFEFVIESLVGVLNYTYDRAEDKAVEIHENGSAVVASFVYEIAEQKRTEIMVAARQAEFPLEVKVEEE